ncbi:protection of telomeres protein 1b isoform X1 [Vigna radiata var. radiata]|uniref:Protection of telomeres protein 1b isoform X1 n=1 Tax=Vigna radiata var. radiata TaxID=3916 RepID=A0A3Q0F1R5_VIGRR|nr:protection of telomeres protein 1b isoform X1 [Vigna radiata var. radiata]
MVVPLRDLSKYLSRRVNVINTVNVIGAVIETTFAKKTKRVFPKKKKGRDTGTDYCCNLRIMDDTHHNFTISATVFDKNIERLPLVTAVGDIIQLRSILVDTYNGEVNLTYWKKISSFALYKGKDDDILDPYQVSSSDFVPKDEDKIIINKLRKWLVNFQLHEDFRKFPMFREFKEETVTNLTCKILHHSNVAKDKWVIYAWDGTDTQPNAICSNLEDELKHPLPLQRERLPLSREILCTLPTVGSIFRIVFETGVQKSHLHLLTVGKWVKITYLRLKLYGGLWHGVFTCHTKLRYISNEDQLIVERQRLADERLSLISRRMSYLSFPEPLPITAVNHRDHVTPVTLMSVLTHSEVTAIFKCIVRVVAAIPCKAENLCLSTEKYKMRLTLKDSTARIHANVIEEDVVTLFDGYPDDEKWNRKLNRLLGVSDSNGSIGGEKDTTRNPPWVCVCLKSYYLSEDDIWGTRNFRVFDTKILEDSS